MEKIGRLMARSSLAAICAALAVCCSAAAPALADSWTIGLYLCGSDLESRGGAATMDLLEAMEANIAKDINFIVMTGGAKKWQNDAVNPKKLQVWKVAGGEIIPIADKPAASMGDPETLAAFMAYLRDSFPADKNALFLWDHGGGSVGGVAYDERFKNDFLSLSELEQALESVFGTDGEPYYDLFGFDACLMATLDTATAVWGHARYMVASQNLEPGNGWQYTHILNGLSRNTGMDGAALGKLVCDSYIKGCREADTEAGATLSVTDLSMMPFLRAAYDSLGLDAFDSASERGNSFYSFWTRSAKGADNYKNSRAEGFTNMVDIGGLAANMASGLPDSANFVKEVLAETVVYKVSGREFRGSSGLSCYFPFDNSKDSWRRLASFERPTAFDVLAGVKIGAIEPGGEYYETALAFIQEQYSNVMSYLNDDDDDDDDDGGGQSNEAAPPQASGIFAQLSAAVDAAANITAPSAVAAFDISKLEDHPVEITNDGEIKLDIGPKVMENMADVLFHLCIYDEDEDVIVRLGSDADLNGDWDRGVFTDNFGGTWAALDEHLVMLELTYDSEEINRYAVPIKLNGKRCVLQVIYDYEAEAYAVIGARELLDSGAPDKMLISLKEGDEVTTIFEVSSLSGDDDFNEVEIETFRLSKGFKFEDTDMGDGTFMFMYEMKDIQGNSATSAIAGIEVKDGEISVMEL